MYNMPELDLSKADLTPAELALAQGIIAKQGKNKGCLRATKPRVTFDPTTRQVTAGGEAAYIWRMVAFAISPKREHKCLPVTATFDLPGTWGDEQRALADRLNAIADKIAATAGSAAWQRGGMAQWARLI